MSDRFEICHPITAGREGGWSNHEADPGGETMYGVTEKRWHEYQDKMGMKRTPVRTITKAQALKFYRSEFWDACGAATLFAGVDLAVYDASVNSGVSRGRKWLKAAIGSSNHAETVKRICRARLSFMQSLAIWKTFGKGWGRRVADIEVRGVAMALAAMGATEGRIKADARAEAEAAKKAAKSAGSKAATSAGGAVASGSAPAVDQAAADPAALWLFGALFLVLAIGAAVMIIRKRVADARADAYGKAAA
ncbi:glycoside hydrolase family 108 protein [Sinorhizobium fredii]|uniref:glycoside hydrolase family 108 protein n=1 Tax=Rhizobium fredii TaxID=380 RepID=UPI003514D795